MSGVSGSLEMLGEERGVGGDALGGLLAEAALQAEFEGVGAGEERGAGGRAHGQRVQAVQRHARPSQGGEVGRGGGLPGPGQRPGYLVNTYHRYVE